MQTQIALGLVDKLKQALPDILRPHPIDVAYLYGSTTSGDATPASDIDIGLVFSPDAPPAADAFRLTLKLEQEIGQRLGAQNLDVRRIDNAPLRVCGKVITSGEVLYTRSLAAQHKFEETVLPRYFDFQPALREQQGDFFSRLATKAKGEGVPEQSVSLDFDKVENLLRELDTYLAQLQTLSQKSLDDFFSDFVLVNATKYALMTAIECCVDLNRHIIARKQLRRYESYGDTFHVLVENEIVPEEFALLGPAMVGLRNRLVHRYWKVDTGRLHEILQDHLDDLTRYGGAIAQYAQQEQEDEESHAV